MDIVRWSPFREFEGMERRMRRMFEDAGLTPSLPPAADVYEADTEFVVELEVPGFEEKELDLEVTDNTLRVKGERTETKEGKDKAFLLKERIEKSFERRFSLPATADLGKIKASFANGVLEIRIPKTPEPKPRKVPIGKTTFGRRA
jgi:HSP20 family protein